MAEIFVMHPFPLNWNPYPILSFLSIFDDFGEEEEEEMGKRIDDPILIVEPIEPQNTN